MSSEIPSKRFVLFAALCGVALFGCSAEGTDPYPDGNGNGNADGGTGGGHGGSGGSVVTPGAGGTSSSGGSAGSLAAGGSAGSAGSGSGGTFAMGGTAGSGTAGTGTGTCTAQVGAATDLMIADVDSTMSNAINMPRVGYWYTFADAAATVDPPPDPTGSNPFPPETTGGANATSFYAGLTGTGGKYAGLGFALNDGGAGVVCTYDVSAYTGISFYYKSSHAIRVGVATSATTAAPKGTCASTCDNHHGKKSTGAAAEWTLFTAKWTELTQEFGTMSPFDKTKVLQLQFQIDGVWNETDMVVDPIVGAYNLAIDEITFTTN
jgi:hypothetical protein